MQCQAYKNTLKARKFQDMSEQYLSYELNGARLQYYQNLGKTGAENE